MPPWTIMHHSTPLTCCIDHTRQKRKGTKKGERKFIIKKGEPPYMTSEKVIMHTWYWLLCDKFRDLLIETLFAVKPQALCGINLRSTTVVCWQVHSPMGDPSSRVEKKRGKEKKFVELSYLNQKFGTTFLQFRFWSGKNHLDGAGWFFVSDG